MHRRHCMQKPFSSLSTSSRPHVEWDSVMVHTDKGGGSFHLHVHTKKKKGERDKNCVRVYHNHPVEKWPRDPGCCAGGIVGAGVPIFFFALSLSRRRRRQKIGFANPQKTKRKMGLNVRNSPTLRSLSLSRVRRYCFPLPTSLWRHFLRPKRKVEEEEEEDEDEDEDEEEEGNIGFFFP